MEKNIEALSELLSLVQGAATSPTDEVVPNTGLQVDTGEGWLPASREVWRSWTGSRAVWGIPYHGPVYSVGTKADDTPWTGPRACGCSTCQEHVAATHRPN